MVEASGADYSREWADLRARRNVFWCALLLSPLISIGAGVVALRVFHTDTPGFLFTITWIVIIGVCWLRFVLFECPQCHCRYFITWWYSNIFARHCVHCGLPKWEGDKK
jgi:hypothetical protein